MMSSNQIVYPALSSCPSEKKNRPPSRASLEGSGMGMIYLSQELDIPRLYTVAVYIEFPELSFAIPISFIVAEALLQRAQNVRAS